MPESVLKDVERVMQYIEQVHGLADEHRDEVGFLARGAYLEAAMKGNLWVAIDVASGAFQGYLLFGGRHPHLRIFHLCVRPEHRSVGVARRIITEFILYATNLSYLNITARVSSELDANGFWQRSGFRIIKQIPGRRSATILNIYSYDMDVPSLFDDGNSQRSSINQAALQIDPKRPLLPTPSYVIDLNVFLDAIRSRDLGQCAQILASALKHQIRLFVTHEFVIELERNIKDSRVDPVLVLAKELPRLAPPDARTMTKLVTDLRALFASTPPGPREWTVNDTSDQIHLATSIHHQAFGFVTSDGTILRNAVKLHDRYSLDVVSPTDIVDSLERDEDQSHVTSITSETRQLTVSVIDARNRADTNRFLSRRAPDSGNITALPTRDPLQQLPESVVVSSSCQIIAMGVWSTMPGPGRDAFVHVYVEEELPDSDRAIDHILEWGSGLGKRDRAWLFNLKIPGDQLRTRQTAFRRGFLRRGRPSSSTSVDLSRVVYKGVVPEVRWRRFRRDFLDLTNLILPEAMPTYNEMMKTGIVVDRGGGLPSVTLSLFDFETSISPGYLIGAGRGAVIVPIKESYSDELLPPTRRQGLLFSQNEADFRLERAYFLKAGIHQRIPRGTVVVFYVSHSRQQAVALGRVTFSGTLTKTQALLNLTRQGVLSEAEIHERANERDEIAVFTFDNVLTFRQSVDFRKLKEMGCVDRTNLVTAQAISHGSFGRIVGEAFGRE